MKKSHSTLQLTAAALALTMAVAPSFAGNKVTPEKMTCEEFLAIDDEIQPAVVYWLHGKSGKVDAIEVDEYDTQVAYIVTECHKDKKATVLEKVDHWFKMHTKPTDMNEMESN
jgi:hypothetical protein